MPTLIAINRKLHVRSLFDIENPIFGHWYGLGVWWALYGDYQGYGRYDDAYLIDNIELATGNGWYDDLTAIHFPTVGFYLGMIHGGNIDPKTHELRGTDTLVVLTDQDFIAGYRDGLEHGEDWSIVTDRLFMEAVNDYALKRLPRQTLAYELGRWIGVLQPALSTATMLTTVAQ
jgi:hypothetical protein